MSDLHCTVQPIRNDSQWYDQDHHLRSAAAEFYPRDPARYSGVHRLHNGIVCDVWIANGTFTPTFGDTRPHNYTSIHFFSSENHRIRFENERSVPIA